MEDITISKLCELFREKAPGSYRHCEAVASLCEVISNEIQLDKTTLITAAKLHDIGKTVHPEMFSENQPKDDNIHDQLTAKESFQIISRHVGDSLVILAQYPSISREVLQVVSQHHGDTCVRSLCAKGLKEDPNVSKDEFRYPFFKPTTKEAAILMIVDVVEAATKSLFNSGKLDDIPNTINTLIDGLVEDRQLDNMLIGDVRTIKQVLYKEIDNIYHKRVPYDEDTQDKELSV